MPRGGLDAHRHTKRHNAVGTNRSPDEVLSDEVGKFFYDPLGYVMFNFPWDTEPKIQIVRLKGKWKERFPNCTYGPDEWACEFLDRIGKETKVRKFNGRLPVKPLRFSTVSGHGIGKSTLVAWITKWIMDTRPYSKGSLTAVTDEQLRTKTWLELGKWHALSMTAHWFEFSSARGNMSMVSTVSPEWRVDAKTCREEKAEAFQGQHAPNATSFFIFDEASGVPDSIFEVREGGLTSGEPMVFDFGNGTRSTGRFYEQCEGSLRHLYIVNRIDSRSVDITNKAKLQEDIDTYGEDSDFIRVRIRGMFPVRGFTQFIASGDVEEAMSRSLPPANYAPIVIGVDCARFGDDQSVIYSRRGLDARSFEPELYSKLDTGQLTSAIAARFNFFTNLGTRPARIFIDMGNIGAAVYDNLVELGFPVTGVWFGKDKGMLNARLYRYRGDEMWGRMRTLIEGELALPSRNSQHGERLYGELTQRQFGYLAGDIMHLESKQQLKDRGLSSPDIGDALALTFAEELGPDVSTFDVPQVPPGQDYDYDPYALGLAH